MLSALVEGVVDEAVAQRIILSTGHHFGVSYGKKGWHYIRDRIKGFNRASASQAMLALVDFMDTNLTCPPEVVRTWLPHPASRMFFRVVLREAESWIMADRASFSKWLGVPLHKVPHAPELVDDPKSAVIGLARSSRFRSIREDLVPATGGTASEGRLYTSRMVEFIRTQWNPGAARANAPSLDRCMKRLEQFQQ